MKLVIDTQHCENYGAHSWNGEGECPQRWKFKGGETYVVENLTPTQVAKIEANGIPTLSNLIETADHSWKEYVTGFNIVDDNASACDEWKTPYTLSYEGGKWVAKRFEEAQDHWEPGFAGKREQYTMLPNGGREDSVLEYIKKMAA